MATAPVEPERDGFVFGKDKGGDEFSQLYWFDLDTRETTLLTDGKRTQNGSAAVRARRQALAYSSTARNGTDTDIWVRDIAAGAGARAGRPRAAPGARCDFSPDGKRLLVMKYVSINEAYPGVVDLATGKLELFPVDGGKAAFGDFAFAPDGARCTSSPTSRWTASRANSSTLRYHDPDSRQRSRC